MSVPPETGPLRIALIGAAGRMGQAVQQCAAREAGRYTIVAAGNRGDELPKIVGAGDAVIDFSAADRTSAVLDACGARGKPLVLGTTGHSDTQRAEIRAAAAQIPIVYAANFSVGVNALFWLTRHAARILGGDFDLEIVEVHHRHKKDAPSGTARRLAEILAEVRGLEYDADARHGRQGLVGERGPGEIGMHAVRGGDVVGEHTVFFAAAGERLELIHRATSRETFAAGALRAAAWALGRPPGLYDMEDVLGLRESASQPPADAQGNP